jgi:hypothetical protein
LESCRYKKKAKGAWRLRGDWKAADTKRKQRELGNCEVIGKLQIQKENKESLEIAALTTSVSGSCCAETDVRTRGPE